MECWIIRFVYKILSNPVPPRSDCLRLPLKTISEDLMGNYQGFRLRSFLRSRSRNVDILPGLKSGASPSLTSLRPLGIEPNGRRSRCIPPLKRRVLANGLP